jgi:hypothetical protein
MTGPTRRAVIAAHFDRDGLLDPHVRATLASLAGPGTRTILVSTNLAPDATIPPDVAVIRRENRGYDFRSWQVGLAALEDPHAYDEVILLNDSFYLARPDALPAALAAMRARRCDLWGLTASRERRAHLQSYFLVFRARALRSPWFRRFWDGVDPDSGREEAIIRYELSLADEARAAGLAVAALLPAPLLPAPAPLARLWSKTRAERGGHAALHEVSQALRTRPGENPMLRGWQRTLRRAGVAKVALLRDTPAERDHVLAAMEAGCRARARAHLARLAPLPRLRLTP